MWLSKVALQVGGCVMIATGLVAAVIAPLEFSLFKNMTKNLVGFGYLGFAAHSGQIFGFYLVALVLVPLGYGHLLGCAPAGADSWNGGDLLCLCPTRDALSEWRFPVWMWFSLGH